MLHFLHLGLETAVFKVAGLNLFWSLGSINTSLVTDIRVIFFFTAGQVVLSQRGKSAGGSEGRGIIEEC